MDSPHSFGNELRRLRELSRKSIGNVARAIGVSTAYVCHLENGDRKPPTSERVLQIAEFFGVDPVPLLSMSCRERGVIELDASSASERAAEIGVNLSLAWQRLGAEDIEAIASILSKFAKDNTDVESGV